MSRRGIVTLIVAGAVLSTVTIILFGDRLNPDPPLKEIENARSALAASKKHKASLYAPQMYSVAEKLYDSAMICWKKENERQPFRRDYSAVKKLASESILKAEQALKLSQKNQSDISVTVKAKTDSLQRAWKDFKEVFNLLPLPGKIRKENTHGIILLLEAEKAYHDKKYSIADEKMELAEKSLGISFRYANNLLTEYFKQYEQWCEWAEQTIKNSKKSGGWAIIVDKFARVCYLYHKGKQTNTFSIELGANWIGDKQRKGDKTTPEGLYKVITKKEGKRTLYYKALLIDYPNAEDKKRFLKNKKSGAIPDGVEPGGNIEIHGGGDKGADWTEGCIALKNSDMNVLYRHVSVGTPVTIVGSLQPLERFLKK